MNSKELKEIALSYMQCWNAGGEDALNQYADENIVADYSHYEKPYKGIPAVKAMLRETHAFFPDMRITLSQIIPNECENSVTIFWEYSGTHQQGTLFGVESSGKKVRVCGITLLQIRDGKVKEEKGIVDNLSLMMQLDTMDA